MQIKKKSTLKRIFSFSRHQVVLLIFLFLVLLLASRLFVLQNNNVFLKSQGNMRTLRTVPITSYRGMITDRNDEPLAISTVIYSVWTNPKKFLESDRFAKYLKEVSKVLKIKPNDLKEKLISNKEKDFLYLKRHITPTKAMQLEDLGITELSIKREYRRFYPEGEVTSHVVGFTDIDDSGQEGLELSYNEWLHGKDGSKLILKDRLGRQIKDLKEISPAKHGNKLTLSIDSGIQYLAYRELSKAVTKHKAKGGSIVVLDVNTGEVLAMVNKPSYNPNKRARKVDDSYRNRAVTDLLEPGSVMKTFSMVNVLEHDKYPDDYMVDTYDGKMTLGENTIKDVSKNGIISIPQVLIKSSNIGISKLTLDLEDDESLYQLLYKLGFGQVASLEFPGESSGILRNYPTWDPFMLSTLSFGYAMAATPLQVASAYAALANDGIKVPITFIKQEKKSEGKRVISSKVASLVTDVLSEVTEKGVHGRAKVKGYKVVGKTGTSKKIGAKGYENRYQALFAGYGPSKCPKLAIVVMIDEPSSGQYYGSLVAAPVFSKVMSGALRALDVVAGEHGCNKDTEQ